MCALCCFFFSSRRRHTRYIGDWSSDVCSSDLVGMSAPSLIFGSSMTGTSGGRMLEILTRLMLPMPAASSALSNALREIGRASCRERVEVGVGQVTVEREQYKESIGQT